MRITLNTILYFWQNCAARRILKEKGKKKKYGNNFRSAVKREMTNSFKILIKLNIQMSKIIVAQFPNRNPLSGKLLVRQRKDKIKNQRRKIAQSRFYRVKRCNCVDLRSVSSSFLAPLFSRTFRSYISNLSFYMFSVWAGRRGRTAEHRWRERGARDETFNKWQSRYEV